MGRLRQFNTNNYNSSGQISAEFENVIRYIVAAERGNRSLAEMFQDLFDTEGNVELGVEFQYGSDGLQMRVGDGDWETLASVTDLRGDPGRDIGDVSLPVITGLATYTATAAQTVFSYVHASTDVLFVHQNGILLAPTADYTTNSTTDTVTLTSGASEDDAITIYKVRGSGGIIVGRTDTTVSAASQSVFGITLPTDAYQEQIYLNGILMRATQDYVINEGTSSLTLLEAAVTDDVLTVIFLSSADATTVPGFLLEGIYTHMEDGLIRIEKIKLPDGGIPAVKVDGLPDFMTAAAKITVGASTPIDPESGEFWLDTSQTPSKLKIYDAADFVDVQPSSALPTIRPSDADYAVFINSTGSGYVYRPIDFSNLLFASMVGVAGGVASLDDDGRLSPSQYPLVRATDVVDFKITGAVADETHVIRRMFGEKVRIIGHSVKTTSGTCSIQLKVSGSDVGSSYSAAAAANDQTLSTVIEIDASVVSKTLEVEISDTSSCTDLWLTIVLERLN